MQFEKKIPLLAYSPMFVRKQAVCSFAASYSDLGKKAAEVAQMIMSGTNVADIPIQSPRGTLTINLNSAAKAGVKIPASGTAYCTAFSTSLCFGPSRTRSALDG